MRTGLACLALLALLVTGPAARGEEGETFYPERAEVGPFPREIPANGSLTFTAKLKRGFHTPVLAVTPPDGKTEYHRPTRSTASDRFEFDVDFRGGRGAWRIELVVDSVRGDTTAAQFTVWAGVPRPPKAAATPGEGGKAEEDPWPPERPDESTLRLERKLFRMVNAYREELGLAPYPWLEKAAILARDHMSDYLSLKPRPEKLTHQIPGKGFLADRFEDFFAWSRTVRKFPVAEPEIGPEADNYCSESLAAPLSLTRLFRTTFLKESAFRAPIISEYPTHAAVGIVRDANGRLYTALVFVQVNSTRVRAELDRETKDLVKAEADADTDEARAAALRLLARYSPPDGGRLYARRLRDRSPLVAAAALDALFLNDLAAAEEWIADRERTLERARERERFGPALSVLRTFANVQFDVATRHRGEVELVAIEKAAEAELDAAFAVLFSGDAEKGKAALEEVSRKYDGLPAAAMARAKLAEVENR